MHALMEFRRSGAYEMRDMGLPRKLDVWYIFSNEVSDGLLLSDVTWSEKMHTLMKFQRSVTYEKQDMGGNLIQGTFSSKVSHSDQVLLGFDWSSKMRALTKFQRSWANEKRGGG